MTNIENKGDDHHGNTKNNIHKITTWISSLQNKLTPTQQLLTDPIVANRAVKVLHFTVFCNAATGQVLGPNYALLVLPNGHPDSFTSTEPFGFAAAFYFLLLTYNLGCAISSTFVGALSDKVGRRYPVLFNCLLSSAACIGRYLARKSFWAFNAVNFINGILSATLAIAMAYVSDVFHDQKKRDQEIGLVISVHVLGNAGGGILGILFASQGLFAPLWIAAGILVFTAILCFIYLIESKPDQFDEMMALTNADDFSLDEQEGLLKEEEQQHEEAIEHFNKQLTGNSNNEKEEKDQEKIKKYDNHLSEEREIPVDINNDEKLDDDDDAAAAAAAAAAAEASPSSTATANKNSPDKLDYSTFFAIVLGSTLDNFGSNGLIPIALSPLMFTTYYVDFIQTQQDPIMSSEAFKWIYALISLGVVPGAILSPIFYEKYGTPLSCVVANVFTGIVVIIVLFVSLINPPTTATFVLFVVIVYCSFPLTAISQLSTGPMLDRIAPESKRGFAQGVNSTIYNLTSAIAPFLFGTLIDSRGIKTCMWTTAGISILAAIANSPLLYHPLLKPKGFAAAAAASSDGSSDNNNNENNNNNAYYDTETGRWKDKPLLSEDETIEKARQGVWVPASQVAMYNELRLQRGEPAILTNFGKYSNNEIQHKWSHEEIKSEYKTIRDLLSHYVSATNTQQGRIAVSQQLNKTFDDLDPAEFAQVKQELGEWVADYLIENGYQLGQSSALFKHMIHSAFPPIGDKVRTPENVRERMLRYIRVLNSFIELEDSWETKVLGTLGAHRQSTTFAIH